MPVLYSCIARHHCSVTTQHKDSSDGITSQAYNAAAAATFFAEETVVILLCCLPLLITFQTVCDEL